MIYDKKIIFKQIECLKKFDVVVQRYYQQLENEIQNAKEIHHLDIIQINSHSKTVFFRRKFSQIQQKSQNVNTTTFKNKLETLSRELGQYVYTTFQKIENKRKDLLCKGLTKKRIKQFYHYIADESNVGDQCTICIQEFEVGRKMMRLDCNHEFCNKCIEGWFANHKTCPNCRHAF